MFLQISDKMIICIAGKNQIAVNACDYLLNQLGYDRNKVTLCPNQSATGEDNWQPSLKKYATENNLNVVHLRDLFDVDDLLFISLEYDKIIKSQRFKTNKLFNIHFSRLPSYKGMYTSVHPILKGEKQTGVTLHEIDDGIDTGPIISQRIIDIEINDTARDLYFKYLETGLQLFKENVANLISGGFTSKQQQHTDSSYYAKNSLDLKNITINLNKTSFEIHNQIRAFIFEEYQLPMVHGFLIHKSRLTTDLIERNFFEVKDINTIVLSGIDGYKVILYTK